MKKSVLEIFGGIGVLLVICAGMVVTPALADPEGSGYYDVDCRDPSCSVVGGDRCQDPHTHECTTQCIDDRCRLDDDNPRNTCHCHSYGQSQEEGCKCVMHDNFEEEEEEE